MPRMLQINKRQRGILIVGCLLIAVAAVFPPWYYEYPGLALSADYDAELRYRLFIFRQGAKLAIGVLTLELIIILALTGVGVLCFMEPRNLRRSPPDGPAQ